MKNERLIVAIGRLERALSRAESEGDNLMKRLNPILAQNNIENKSGDSSIHNHVSHDAYKQLENKHIMLKEEASKALHALDSIIAHNASDSISNKAGL